MTYRGTIRKGVVVLEGGATLPETHVTVATVDPSAQKQPAPAGPNAGSAKGKVRMSADFDEPLSDFAEYMK